MKRAANQKLVRAGKCWFVLGWFVLVPVLLQLTGCSSTPINRESYNSATGFPAVGANY